WLSAQNWKPSDKRFQIFFEARFPNESSRILIYKYYENSTLRFLIASGNKEAGYISVPMKDADWHPGMWHKLDAVWNCEKMLLYIDGKLTKTITFKQALNIQGGDSPKGTIRLGINPGFRNNNGSDVTGYDEVRIFKRMLSAEEIAAGYKADRSGNTAEAAPTVEDADLLFHAGFDGGVMTADKASGKAEPQNFKNPELGELAGKGVADKGAMFLDNTNTVIYPAAGNIDWREGTISMWLSAHNWKPSDKHFQIFFEGRFPNEISRFIIYKYFETATLRFLIASGNKEVGYISVPVKDADWQPGMWHKLDAVWNCEKMLFYIDGKLMKTLTFKQALDIKGGDSPQGTIRLGINPGFSNHNKSDVTGYDEFRIFKRMLSAEEIAASYKAERSGKTAAAAQDKKKTVIESKPAAQKAAAAAPAQKTDASLQDPSLLFKATFDTYSVTAEKGKGGCKSTNFVPDNLMLRMHPGVAQVGNALTLNNRESAIYPNKDNFDWRKGTISLWVSARNWLPSKKKFQIFFQSKFTHDTRFIVYKFVDPAHLRFIIVVKNKQIGYVHVPLKDSEWQPDVWHKIDAVWDEKSMALYLDGNLAAQQPYTHNPFQYRSPLEIPDEVQPRFMQIGMDSSFGHDPDDVTAFDEVEIYDRMLTPAEIRQGYEKFIKPVNTGDNPNMVTLPEGKEVTIDGKLDAAEWADAAVIPVVNPVRQFITSQASAKVYLKHNGGNMLIGAEIAGGAKASLEGNDLVDVWRDDAFEIHLMNSAKKRYQFIINPLASFYDAVIDRDDGHYDMTSLNSKWNSGAKLATSRGKGSWFVEIAIPRDAVGAGSEILGTFCATRYLEKSYHVAWGMNAESFYDEKTFGRIIFGGRTAPVCFEQYAPYQGHFDLNKDVKLNLVFAGGKTIARPDGIGEWKLDLPSGIYDLSAKGSGYNFSSRFTIDQPLVVSYNCYASRKLLEVKADLSAAGSAVRNAMQTGSVKGTVRLVDEAGKVCISEDFTPKDIESIVNLKLPELKQGVYYVEAAVNTGDGKSFQARKRFRVPDMTPYKLKVAQDHTVPRPWTPVKQLNDKTYEVWNRTFTFGDGPFPVQVVSEGEKLLKEGPNFHLDGKPVKWSGFKVTEKHDDYVRLEGRGAAGNLTFRWQSDLCFDGLVKTRIFMNPAKGSAEIRDLRLKWRVPEEYARAMLDPLYSGYRNRDGEVYNFPYAHGEDFIIWTLGLKKGFLYWTSSNANWNNPPGHKQFSLSRKGDTVYANADYITQAATLTKEAVYSLAFMATPGRPVPERRRDFNLGQIWDFLKYETAKIQYFGVSAKPAPESTEPWTSLKPLDPVKFGQHIKDIAAKGSSYLPYSQPARTCTVEESYDYFFPEWRQKPGWPVGGGISHLTGEFYYPEATCGHT
ncbi:MAG: hypothetical protein J6S21_06530, partial [Victivallales bacterium]|nr:hypothetical protein [Victivallales bacterium]